MDAVFGVGRSRRALALHRRVGFVGFGCVDTYHAHRFLLAVHVHDYGVAVDVAGYGVLPGLGCHNALLDTFEPALLLPHSHEYGGHGQQKPNHPMFLAVSPTHID